MYKFLATTLIALAGVTTAGTPSRAADMGRLFLTPEQRDDLDRRRANNVQDAVVTAASRVTVGGQVARSSGRNTVWLNGIPQFDGPRAPDPARVAVPKGEQEGTVTLKIGETLDRASGEVNNGLDGGTIAVGPQKRRRP